MRERRTHSLSSSPTLVRRNFLDRALNLHQIQCLTLQIHRIAQDGLALYELVLVSSYEMKLFGRRHDVEVVRNEEQIGSR